MDKLKTTVSSARNRVAERTSRGTGTGSLSVPHSTLPPADNSSLIGVNEGNIGPQPGTVARDFANSANQPTPQPMLEPPTSLQSSVDAGMPVPVPERPLTAPNASTANGARPQPQTRQRSNSAGIRGHNGNRPEFANRQSSIGIRRLGQTQGNQAPPDTQKPLPRLQKSTSRLPVLDETCALEQTRTNNTAGTALPLTATTTQEKQEESGVLRKLKTKLGLGHGEKWAAGGGIREPPPTTQGGQGGLFQGAGGRTYDSNMVDVLDTLDAEVQTLTSLTNVQNSLFIPNLGRWVNRRPTYTLRQTPSELQSIQQMSELLEASRQAEAQEAAQPAPTVKRMPSNGTLATVATIDSTLSDTRFAVLPHGASLDGWTKEDKAELNDHVRHMLHSKRSKFKRSMRGFGQYVRRPLGFLVTLYATLITLFGLAWVLFLIGWINVGGRQIYVVHIIDSVLVALFAIVGDGLAPFRAVDTYHMIYIAHYHHFTWSRRKKDQLPKLKDHNDLPDKNAPIAAAPKVDPEDPEKQWEFTVLTPKQQAKLEHHESKFCKSHSFYKPHETETHYAFPLRLLVAIVVLLDCHSLLQISLGACTWGIYYKTRPFAITTVILICSITCNATAGLLILIGDRKTRKKDVLERMNRQELTEEAIQLVEKKKQEREGGESDTDDMGSRRMSLDVLKRKAVSPPPVPRKDGSEKRSSSDGKSSTLVPDERSPTRVENEKSGFAA